MATVDHFKEMRNGQRAELCFFGPKPEYFYERGVQTEKTIDAIDANPENTIKNADAVRLTGKSVGICYLHVGSGTNPSMPSSLNDLMGSFPENLIISPKREGSDCGCKKNKTHYIVS